ncbi:MAG: RraA family protein [Clostridia bacterium]|jgi:regulator of RNase E activity RraA|nr:RraA family protein [Clostridia bacterium]
MPIITDFPRPKAEIVQAYRDLLKYDSPTCALTDCMGRFNAMTSDMKPLFEGIRIVGTAVTAQALASDISAPFKAIDLAQPGDIIVIDGHGSVNSAFWGENMTMSAMNKGVIGVIIDGATRDVEEIKKLKFPVLSKGVVPNVGSVSGYGNVNVPVSCGGVSVRPGDIIVVDMNGVAVIAREQAEEILAKAQKLLETEHIVQEKIKQGATIGQLVNIDEVFKNTFAYQEKAAKSRD